METDLGPIAIPRVLDMAKKARGKAKGSLCPTPKLGRWDGSECLLIANIDFSYRTILQFGVRTQRFACIFGYTWFVGTDPDDD